MILARAATETKEVLIVDGHPAMRFGLRRVLGDAPGLRVTGDCDEGEEALKHASALRPDVVVLGLNLADGPDGVQVCWALKKLPRPPRVMVHTAYNFSEDVCSCLLAGADSYVHKSVGCRELLEAVSRTARGERVWSVGRRVGEPRSRIRTTSDGRRLTDREREITVLMLRGLSNEEMAEKMYLGLPTVKTHVRSLLRKMGLKNRWELLLGPSHAKQ